MENESKLSMKLYNLSLFELGIHLHEVPPSFEVSLKNRDKNGKNENSLDVFAAAVAVLGS